MSAAETVVLLDRKTNPILRGRWPNARMKNNTARPSMMRASVEELFLRDARKTGGGLDRCVHWNILIG
jgi:hypothetical protein